MKNSAPEAARNEKPLRLRRAAHAVATLLRRGHKRAEATPQQHSRTDAVDPTIEQRFHNSTYDRNEQERFKFLRNGVVRDPNSARTAAESRWLGLRQVPGGAERSQEEYKLGKQLVGASEKSPAFMTALDWMTRLAEQDVARANDSEPPAHTSLSLDWQGANGRSPVGSTVDRVVDVVARVPRDLAQYYLDRYYLWGGPFDGSPDLQSRQAINKGSQPGASVQERAVADAAMANQIPEQRAQAAALVMDTLYGPLPQ